jgi:integrase
LQPTHGDGIFDGIAAFESHRYRHFCRYDVRHNRGLPVLTVVAIKNGAPAAKPYKLADAGGLYLLINPSGSKLWRLDYRYGGRRKTMALGAFPERSLVEARQARDEAKRALKGGTDPSAEQSNRRRVVTREDHRSFRAVAARWFAARRPGWAPAYATRIWSRIEHDILPVLGDRYVGEVEPGDVLTALRRVEERGAIETARRLKNHLEDLFRYAKAERLVQANPCLEIGDALARRPPPKRRAALKGRDLPEFLAALEAYDGDLRTKLAIRFTLLTFVRTSEVRFARWDEFEGLDGSAPLWRIPAERMKMRDEHIVPLAPQAVDVLRQVRGLTLGSQYVFASPSGDAPMSENTMLFALYRMGYHNRATIHGFRGTASTVLNEHGFNCWIERQLAHAERNGVRAAYNSAEWLPQRRKMMRWWADYLGRLSAGPRRV